ncbi:right-handed parallel beta-helix repeat-containing protein [Arachnia propionica]|nr:right-handed parallel beta-helix repeat-containing protein [Arachnia propionica]
MHRHGSFPSVLAVIGAMSLGLAACQSSHTDTTSAVPAPPQPPVVTGTDQPVPEEPLLEDAVLPEPPQEVAPEESPTAQQSGVDDTSSPTGPAPQTVVDPTAISSEAIQQPAPLPSTSAEGAPSDPGTVAAPAPEPTAPAPTPTAPGFSTPAPVPPPAGQPTSQSLEAFLDRSGLTEAHAAGQVPVVSSVAEARTLSRASDHVVVSDGTSHVVFDKGAASEVTETFSGSSYGARFQDCVELIAWDIPADAGETLNTAAELAARKGTTLALAPSQTYRYSGTVKLPRDLTGIEGRGATLTPTGKGSSARPAIAVQLETESTGMSLHDFTMDMAETSHGIGIQGNSVKDLNIRRIHIANANHRGIQLSASVSDIDNVLIEDSRIDNVTGEPETKGVANSIVIEAVQEQENTYDRKSPYWDRYTDTGGINPQRLHARNIRIRNNRITGGYYGIAFSGVSESTISGNTITMNMRNISMQNNSSGNTVQDNHLLEGGSSGVTIGYNSDGNVLRNNTVTSGRASRQALLQAYQGSDGNQFIDNSITVTGDGNPQWMMYAGTDSHGTVFSGNHLKGRARKAAIGVESVWDATSILSRGSNPYSYMSSGYIPSPVDGEKVTYNGGFGPLRNVSIIGNDFATTNAQAPLVYVGADVSRGRRGDKRIIGDVTDLTVSGNTASGAYSEKVVVHEGTIDGVGEAKVRFKDASFGPS